MKLDTFITIVLLAGAVLLLCTGCESRNFTATRPDGTVVTYHRVSMFGDSSSEGVSIAKEGESLTVDVGATGSQARVELIGAMLEALK